MARQETNLNPTPEWKPEDRMRVAASIAGQLKEQIAEGFVSKGTIYDAAGRIELILTQSPGFLELNRKAILEGQPPADSPIKA